MAGLVCGAACGPCLTLPSPVFALPAAADGPAPVLPGWSGSIEFRHHYHSDITGSGYSQKVDQSETETYTFDGELAPATTVSTDGVTYRQVYQQYKSVSASYTGREQVVNGSHTTDSVVTGTYHGSRRAESPTFVSTSTDDGVNQDFTFYLHSPGDNLDRIETHETTIECLGGDCSTHESFGSSGVQWYQILRLFPVDPLNTFTFEGEWTIDTPNDNGFDRVTIQYSLTRLADADGDGVPDNSDACPTVFGTDPTGCSAAITVILTLPEAAPGRRDDFALTGAMNGLLLPEGEKTQPIAPGTADVSVYVPDGWELSSFSCDDTDSTVSGADVQFMVAQNEHVTCTAFVFPLEGTWQTFGPRGKVLVALGDSYQSGEGAGEYDPMTLRSRDPAEDRAGCHRSYSAYPFVVAEALSTNGAPWNVVSVACSGAEANAIYGDRYKGEAAQSVQLARILDAGTDVGLITIGIGGNNASFSDMVTFCYASLLNCVDDYFLPAEVGGNPAVTVLDDLIETALFETVKAYEAVRDTVESHSAVSIPIVVVGYPVFMGHGTRTTCVGALSNYEANFMHFAIERFNIELAKKAATMGFRFADLAAAYGEHVLCEAGDHEEWINNADELGTRCGVVACESFHPKPAGHAATAPVVRACFLSAAACPLPQFDNPNAPAVVGAGQAIVDVVVTADAITIGVDADFPAIGDLSVYLQSEPAYLGSFAPGSTLSATLPANISPGVHLLSVCGSSPTNPLNRVCARRRIVITGGSSYTPLVPARLLESRTDASLTTIDGQALAIGPRPPGSITEVQVTGRAGVPNDASAVALNITVTDPQAPGYITVYPCGNDRPTASNLNYIAGTTIANAVLSKIGADGKICLYTQSTTHLITDVTGYVST